MEITINITTGNAAFSDGNLDAEVARILRALAGRIEGMGVDRVSPALMDFNGNRVGTFAADGDDEEDE